MRKYLLGFILFAATLLGVGCSEHHYAPYGYRGGPYYGGPYAGPYIYRYPGDYRVYRHDRRDRDHYRHEMRERERDHHRH